MSDEDTHGSVQHKTKHVMFKIDVKDESRPRYTYDGRVNRPRPAKQSHGRKQKREAKTKKQVRRPVWNDNVHATPTFDGTLRKSLLFQPGSFDRDGYMLRPDFTEDTFHEATDDSHSVASDRSNKQLRHHKNDASQSHSRVKKDFITQNIERLAGQRMKDIERTRARRRTKTKGNVFDRLASPAMHRSKFQFRNFPSAPLSPTMHSPQRTPSPRRHAIYNENEDCSPDTPTPPTSPDIPGKSRRGRRRNDNQSFSHPLTPPVSDDQIPLQVFRILDRSQRGQLDVGQIQIGLQLLNLPASKEQISDYIYLIHEGRKVTIDIEEWRILVDTLEATTESEDRMAYEPNEPNEPNDNNQDARVHPVRKDDEMKKTPHHGFSDQNVYHRGHMQTPFEPSTDGFSLRELERRLESMIERAEVSTKGATQSTHEQDPRRMLQQAAGAVYGLKTNLFPLVHQAEQTIRELQKHHGARPSLFLSPMELMTITHNSEDLANAILDEILLDMVQLLNEEDKLRTERKCDVDQQKQLEAILTQIDAIEKEEAEMAKQCLGWGAICSTTTFNQLDNLGFDHLVQNDVSEGRDGGHLTPEECDSGDINLTLPLGVIMNINAMEDVGESIEKSDEDTIQDDQQCTLKQYDSNAGPPPDQILEATLHNKMMSSAVLRGDVLERIQQNRDEYKQYRQKVEKGLRERWHEKHPVIETLEEMILEELLDDCVYDLDTSFGTLTESLVSTIT